MRKVFVGLLLVVVLSVFAATIRLTDNLSVIVGGTVNFQLLADKNGIDVHAWIDGSLTGGATWGRLQFTLANATFRWLTSTTFIGGTFDLRQVRLTNKYFNLTWDRFVYFTLDDYLAGQDGSGNPIFGSTVTPDGLLITTPHIKDLVIRYVDTNNRENTDDTGTWFSDYVAVQYPFAGWKLTGAIYRETAVSNTHEFGLSAYGNLDLLFVKPNIRVFVGGVYNNNTQKMEPAYDVFARSEHKLPPITIKPELKYGRNLEFLNYKSTYIDSSKYVAANVVYSQEAKPLKFTIDVTPKYDIADSKFTMPLNAGKLELDFGNTTAEFKVYSDDVISAKPLGLFSRFNVDTKVIVFDLSGNIPDVSNFANYEYVHLNLTAKVFEDTNLSTNFRLTPDKYGYNVIGKIVFSENYYAEAMYGTLEFDSANNKWNILPESKWYAKLFYQAAF